VGQGSYQLSSPLALSEGISIYGGYSGAPDWVRNQVDSYFTHIVSASPIAIFAENIIAPTHLEWYRCLTFLRACAEPHASSAQQDNDLVG
jgi:hypothetical protein